MNLSKSHLIIYTLLAIICILVGVLIRQWQSYDAKLAWWRYGSQKCLSVAERQNDLIRGLLK
jgi:hypothetical protein